MVLVVVTVEAGIAGEFHGQRSLAATVHGIARVGHDCATFTPLSWGAQASTTLPEEA